MSAALLAARLVLAAAFALAGCAKLADLAGSRQAVQDFGVPLGLAGVVSRALPAVELLVALALVLRPSARWGGLAALILLAMFAAVIVIALRRGDRPSCHCFGQLDARPVGWTTLVRNLGLAALACFVLAGGRQDPGLGVPAALGHLGAAAAIGLAAGVALAATLALMVWIVAGVLRQQGRLLARLEAMEAANGASPGAARPRSGAQPGDELAVGERAPDLSLLDTAGEARTLGSMLGGQPALLVFADPSCGPCSALLPDLARWQARHSRTAALVLVTGGSVGEASATSREHHIARVLIDPHREAFRAFGIRGTPTGVLVDAAGRIAGRYARGAGEIRVLIASDSLDPGGGSQWTLGVGDRLPALRLTDPSGRQVDISQGDGEPHAVLLWDPQCPYCQRLVPELRALQGAAARPCALTVVVNRSMVGDELAGLDARVLRDPLAQLGSMLGADRTPSAVLIDAEGRISSSPLVGAPAIIAALSPSAGAGDALGAAAPAGATLELTVREPVTR